MRHDSRLLPQRHVSAHLSFACFVPAIVHRSSPSRLRATDNPTTRAAMHRSLLRALARRASHHRNVLPPTPFLPPTSHALADKLSLFEPRPALMSAASTPSADPSAIRIRSPSCSPPPHSPPLLALLPRSLALPSQTLRSPLPNSAPFHASLLAAASSRAFRAAAFLASAQAASSGGSGGLLTLNALADREGARRTGKRVGRGMGSGKGKTAGRGHKGQKARAGRNPKIGFEGGQTPLRIRLPKRGFHNPFSLRFQVVNVRDVVRKVEEGAIDASHVISMKTLKDAGLGGKAMRDGVKLLGRGAHLLSLPLHLEVSRASESVRKAVEAAGGRVTRVHYNSLGLRALLKPHWFAKKGRVLPRPARPPPRILQLGLVDAVGTLPAPTHPVT
ncbi:unnamed protein product [Closterium sp. NIES-54]